MSCARILVAAAFGATLVLPGAADAAVPATPTFTTSVDAYPPSDRALCDPTAKPGVQAFRSMMLTANPGVGNSIDGIVRACGGESDHQEGRAWDWGLETRNASDVALVDEIVTWLTETVNGSTHMRARRLGIRYFIWNNEIYVVDGPSAGWEQYHSCSGGWSNTDDDRVCHRNHIHFSWSRAGALKQTSWWGGTVATTTPTNWVLTNYNQGSSAAYNTNYGNTSQWPVIGDWDGDGDDSMGNAAADGSWRWYLINSNSGGSPSYAAFGYGADECTPLTGDWDGDGDDTPGVACVNGTQWAWSLTNSQGGSPSYTTFNYGSSSCTPVTGNWDGSGGDTVGVACAGTTSWQWSLINALSSGSPSYPTFGYGSVNCDPVVGNWDGTSTNLSDTIGIACANTSWSWSLRNTNSAGAVDVPTFSFGSANGTRPVVGDWNGDGKTTVGIVTKPNDWA